MSIMTIHQSKGLEFSCVFVCGLTECILPSRRTLEESGEMGLEEERRLMYVALTRAREKLYLTAPEDILTMEKTDNLDL